MEDKNLPHDKYNFGTIYLPQCVFVYSAFFGRKKKPPKVKAMCNVSTCGTNLSNKYVLNIEEAHFLFNEEFFKYFIF